MDRSVKQSTSKEASDNIGQQDDNRTTVHHQTRLASSKQSLKTVFINKEKEKQPHVDTVLQQFTSFQNRMSDLENSESNLIDHRFTKLEITYLTRKLECLQHSNRDSIHGSIKPLRVSVVLLHCKSPTKWIPCPPLLICMIIPVGKDTPVRQNHHSYHQIANIKTN